MKTNKERQRHFLFLAITDLLISILCLVTFARFQPGTFLYLFMLIVGILAFLVGLFYAFLFVLTVRKLPPTS